MKKLILLLCTAFLASEVYAETVESLSIGFGGGYSSYNTFGGELYLQTNIQLFKLSSELKFGLNNRSYQLSFDGVSGLEASSIGFFGDIAIFPFNKGLFTGVRWELININWLSGDSKVKIFKERLYHPVSYYSGTCFFFQVGYKFDISNRFGIRIYGQPGLQQFKISNGQLPPDTKMEEYFKFIYNINLSFDIRIK